MSGAGHGGVTRARDSIARLRGAACLEVGRASACQLNYYPRRGRKVVDSGGLEKLNRRFAIWHKIQLNPFASRQIARFPLFLNSLIFACFAPVLVTIW
jgi:hypothetical protein